MMVAVLLTLRVGDRLVWLIVPIACAVAAAGLLVALATIVLLVHRQGAPAVTNESALPAASSAGLSAQSPYGRLVVREGHSAGLVIPLSGAVTRVGRERPFSDVVIVDEYVSNPHFSLVVDAGRVFIVDEASINGTRVEGLALRPHQRFPLGGVALIEVGQTSLEFVQLSNLQGEAKPYVTRDLEDDAS